MTHDVRRLPLRFAVLFFVVTWSSIAFADRDRTQVGHNLSIGPDEEVGEVTCFGCSIRVRGHVSGDATAFGGSIVVEDQGQVGGDATVFGGDVRIDKQVKIGGDVTVFGGQIRRDPAATVGGDVTNMGGHGWIFLIFLTPLIVLGLFLALIVWLIRRLLRPSVSAAA
ncbi:MAG TPA: polymer-forming cytoskeletal protein [Candidatus Acidoferrum sp.]|nr:polymer-forming cytoskeletal protein [Candidatus Acidoferrum sp.]